VKAKVHPEPLLRSMALLQIAQHGNSDIDGEQHDAERPL
jgi:hypothetical protein